MPQWFCWYRRSGLLGQMRRQCVVNGHRGSVETLHHLHALDQRSPAAPRIARLVHAAARHSEHKVRRVAWVDDDGVQFRAIGRAVLDCSHPLAELWIVIDGRQWRPAHAAVLGAKQALRRGAGVPGVTLAGVARRKPEGVVHRARRQAVRWLAEGRRLTGFLPGLAKVGGAEHRRSQVAGLRRGQQRAIVAWIELDG